MYPFQDSKGNFNHDIHIRDISQEDYYNGLCVQSYYNTSCIYQIRQLQDDKWYYKPTHNIIIRSYKNLNSELEKTYGNWRPIQNEKWSETYYSVKVNKIELRDKNLNKLLES